MKKNVIFITLLILIFGLTLNVNAANTIATEDSANFNTLKAKYDSNNRNLETISVTGTELITLYGYSDCSTSGCTYKYAGSGTTDFKEVLKKAVVCTGGEKNIIYQLTGGADGVKETNSQNADGDVYWSEEFSVTCTSETTGDNLVSLNNNGAVPTTAPTTTPNNNSTGGSGYGSATTVDPSETGVETYYIILGIVGVLAYVSMYIIKKYNLFKNI